jgi:hypothetical protein
MASVSVKFTSYVDRKGYKIVPFKPKLPKGQSLLDIPLRDIQPARITRNGGERRPLRLNEYPMAYGEFANIRTSDELLAFITKYGPLTEKNEIQKLLDEAAEMKASLRKRKLPTWSIVDLKASFSTDKASGSATIKYSPARLLDALWLQLSHELSSGAQVKQCVRCGNWFSVGGKSRRRLVAQFCTDKCRIEFNSLARTRRKRSR